MPNQMQKEKPQEEKPKPVQAPAFSHVAVDPVDDLLKELENLRDQPLTKKVKKTDGCGCTSYVEVPFEESSGGF